MSLVKNRGVKSGIVRRFWGEIREIDEVNREGKNMRDGYKEVSIFEKESIYKNSDDESILRIW